MDGLDVVEIVGFLISNFPHHSTKNLWEIISEFSKVKKIHRKETVVFLNTNDEPSEKKENKPIYNCIKKKNTKIPRNKLNKGRESSAHWKLWDINEEIEKDTNKE